MAKEMLINTVEDQECRIAIVSDGRLEQLYVERASSASHVGNIYKGRLTNIEASIQAAFVDFGLVKNGFLHISDVHPQYFPDSSGSGESEPVGRKRSHRERPPIQRCLRRGQEVVVQMTKEGIGTKGPTLTTYLSIPGRLLVMMPGMSRLGVSRKIEEDDARHRARQLLAEMSVPSDIGFIVRTAGAGRSKRELQRDLNYLLRLWKSVSQRIKRCKAPAEIYRESDLVTCTIRDVYSSDIGRVICDSEAVAWRVKELLNIAMPRSKNSIELYTAKEGLFHDYGLESEIEKIYSRRVELKSGGSLVIDQTEALVAIDVNSGRFRKHSDAETTAMKMNLEAAGEIGRQLSLRDLGGVIIIDFIDMREEKNRRAVERAFRAATKGDRAKTKVLHISTLGMVEMTRQRLGPSLKSNIYRTCQACDGMGLIKSEESQALMVMRTLQLVCANDEVDKVEVRVTPSVAHHLTNYQRRQIARLEADADKTIIVQADPELQGDDVSITCTNARGSRVEGLSTLAEKVGQSKIETTDVDQLPAPRQEQPSLFDDGDYQDDDEADDQEQYDEGGDQDQRDEGGDRDRRDEGGDRDQRDPAGEDAQGAKPARRRGRRGGRKHKRPAKGAGASEGAEQDRAADRGQVAAHEHAEAEMPEAAGSEPPRAEADAATPADPEAEAPKTQQKSRRRSRRSGKKRRPNGTEAPGSDPSSSQGGPAADASGLAGENGGPEPGRIATAAESADPPAPAAMNGPGHGAETQAEEHPEAPKRKRRTRRGRKKSTKAKEEGSEPAAGQET